ncbi:MAG: hypothetical protein Q9217_006463, partial [Psora testacea]
MTKIPELSAVPIFGNISDIDSTNIHASYTCISNVHGEVFAYKTAGQHVVVVNSHDLYNDVCDETRFEKRPVASGLGEMRNGLGDGLFTSYNEEENWGLAHRTLMPKFGPFSIKDMFNEMYDISCQLVSKWARQGPEHPIDPTDDFTRLTLDSIALCAMDTRFNSFYREKSHPFVEAMVYFLQESSRRAFRPSFMSDYVYRAATKRYWQCIETLQATALQAIKHRQEHPSQKPDLLNAMIQGKDPKTGEGMTDQSIVYNAITFLIAGHETTAGFLGFLFILLIINPRTLKAAQSEVDNVVNTTPIRPEHLSKLPYINACMREAIRLWPTAPGPRVSPKSHNDADYPVYIGKNMYPIQKDDIIATNLLKIHRDPATYGEDADEFIPERMLDENFNKLPPNSWKPFGNGMRACLGKDFAWQEATLNVAMILQNFDLWATDPSYTMKYSQMVTIKPTGFTMHARLRADRDPLTIERQLWGGIEPKSHKKGARDSTIKDASTVKKTPMTIVFGSNAGTCESLAYALANTASDHGYNPQTMSLDGLTEQMPTDRPVLIVTASYEGEPPDNAARFVKWLQNLQANELKGVKYAVFGCGNHDWVSTFHRIPKLVDRLLEEHGATRMADIGLSDVASGHVFDDFDEWQDEILWSGVGKYFETSSKLSVQNHGLDIRFHPTSRTTDLRQDVSEAVVQENTLLTAPGCPEKRHLTLQIPAHMTYNPGDYLAILPMNPVTLIKSIMARFGLAWDTTILIPSSQHTSLPKERALSVHDLLSAYVELNSLATQKHISTLISHASDASTRDCLSNLTTSEISAKHITPVSLLIAHPTLSPPFGEFLAMLPPLRVRQYSISSSPMHSPHTSTLTYSVLTAPSLSNPAQQYQGAASTYLSELYPGDRIHVAVKASHAAFHPPLDLEHVPLIMICAGTGVAPFRGFVQQRAEQIVAGKKVAPALLFVGCRHWDKDALYRREFSEWAKLGAVEM